MARGLLRFPSNSQFSTHADNWNQWNNSFTGNYLVTGTSTGTNWNLVPVRFHPWFHYVTTTNYWT